MYDTDLIRFYAVDPALQTASPYQYCFNNPISYVDITGMISEKAYARLKVLFTIGLFIPWTSPGCAIGLVVFEITDYFIAIEKAKVYTNPYCPYLRIY